MGTMSILPILLSIFSLLCSIILAIIDMMLSKKINNINNEANIYDNIFAQILEKQMPYARKKLQFTSNRLEKNNYIEFTNTLIELRKGMLYFNYRKPKFYAKLEKMLIELDEYILVTSNKAYIEITEQNEILKVIDKKLNKIYNCIYKNKAGKKF